MAAVNHVSFSLWVFMRSNDSKDVRRIRVSSRTAKARILSDYILLFLFLGALYAMVLFFKDSGPASPATTASPASSAVSPAPAAQLSTSPAKSISELPLNNLTGKTVVLKQDSLIASSEAAYEELRKATQANNQDAIARMLVTGRLSMAGMGTRVTIVKIERESVFVEVLDGPTAGVKGLILGAMK